MIARRARTRTDHAGRTDAGFTLIEVLIAISILSLMMAIAWGAVSQTIKAKVHFTRVQTRFHEVRVAMNRMSADISMAYLSGNEDRSLVDPRTFFVGESSASFDSLRFSAFAHTRLYADANESDQTVISYYVAADPDDRSQEDLFRRESRRTANDHWDNIPGEADVLLTGVSKIKFGYWDVLNQEWKETWSTQSADGTPNKLPDRVRMTITFKDEFGKDVTFTTQTRIYMQEMLQFYAN